MTNWCKGQFLIAGRALKDRNFHRTVVLIVEHNSQGAMGLVVNRPSSISVAEALQGHFEIEEDDSVVFHGGPVEPSALFILYTSPLVDDNESEVVTGLYLGSNADVFQEVVRTAIEGSSEVAFRVYSGCSGWGPGQLEGELAGGDWHRLPATRELVLDHDPYDLWETMMRLYAEHSRILPEGEVPPEWN